VNKGDSIFYRLYEYQWERFPFVIVFLTSIAVLGSSLVVLDAQVGLWRLVAGFLTLVLFPFHMRLFDELKDLEHDGQHYPDRPVSRGLVSISEIKLILVFVLVTIPGQVRKLIGLVFWRGAAISVAWFYYPAQ
jgi:4-hydroxybenzoate polyprenyltransferase